MMDPKELMAEAAVLEPQLQNWRRTLHRHPEVGFDLPQTRALVKQALTEMGYTPQDCGKAGILVLAGGKKPGKTILLRGDMDALPVQEESGVDFASEVPGRMHGCGHDMHTAMMLGAAKLLKAHEEELEGTVKLEFQPAEEIFQGSPDMIANGLLENPKVDAAVMFHVLAGMPLPSGMVLVPGGGITMAGCEQYHITVHGKGGHGSMPEACIDPITAAAHIHIALQEINSREMDPHSFGVFTTGRFQAGAASNVIPDTAECVQRHGTTPAAYLDSLGLFEHGGGGYHCIWFTDEEIELFRRKGLTAVTNPGSNTKLASGIANTTAFLKHGVNLAIGTDGPASNNCLDMFREMFLVTGLGKLHDRDASAVPAEEVLKMAVTGGAKAMGLTDCDCLAEGKKADLIMIDLNQPNMQPINNPRKNLVYSGSKQNVKMTMINGKILYEDQKFFIGVEPKEVYKKANEIITRMRQS